MGFRRLLVPPLNRLNRDATRFRTKALNPSVDASVNIPDALISLGSPNSTLKALLLFWLVVLVVSTGCLYLLLVPVVARGADVSFTADTRYLPWTTTFPAVSICELYHPKMAQRKFTELYPELMKSQSYDLQRYLTELVYNKALLCRKGVCEPCGSRVPCNLDWRGIIEKVHQTCNELITDCILDGKAFPCCSKFHQVDSEYGPCYSFNTLQGKRSSEEPLYSVNRTTGPGVMTFRLMYDATVSLHSTEDLSTNYLDLKLKLELRPLLRQYNDVEYIFSLVEFDNDPMLVYDDVYQRRCRYLHEIPDTPFDTYSIKTNQKLKHVVDDDLDDDDPCLPSCLESELTTVHISSRWVTDGSPSGIKVTIRMAGLPNVRFQRNLLRSDLDLVGTASLLIT
ncbi:uncharacterized protein LOC126382297 [Pectinophora gossypiella]|uniref:uncharacterized protein LOC126382297 n=1 Tax=Pectinophora gossypiella TaxID=13191 RepID=UPI00214F1587|nr:uncharacterized protein LOC126382297 [Pectinophora gossypiella]